MDVRSAGALLCCGLVLDLENAHLWNGAHVCNIGSAVHVVACVVTESGFDSFRSCFVP